MIGLVISIFVYLIYSYSKLVFKNSRRASEFRKRKKINNQDYLSDFSEDENVRKLALCFREVLSEQAGVDIECFYSDDRIQYELSDLPSSQLGFPWDEVLIKASNDLSVSFTGEDFDNVNNFEDGNKEITIKDATEHLASIIAQKRQK